MCVFALVLIVHAMPYDAICHTMPYTGEQHEPACQMRGVDEVGRDARVVFSEDVPALQLENIAATTHTCQERDTHRDAHRESVHACTYDGCCRKQQLPLPIHGSALGTIAFVQKVEYT